MRPQGRRVEPLAAPAPAGPAAEPFGHLPSTAFWYRSGTDAAGTDLIRCWYPKCPEHGGNDGGDPEEGLRGWQLQTEENSRRLERHVAEAAESHVTSAASESRLPPLPEGLGVPQKLPQHSTVIVVLEARGRALRTCEWLLPLMHCSLGRSAPVVVRMVFASRVQLLRRCAELSTLRGRRRVFVCVVAHSPDDGQVFDCSPCEELGVSELCSVHDLVRALSESVGSALRGVHLSCCQAMHRDHAFPQWPHPIEWYSEVRPQQPPILLSGFVEAVQSHLAASVLYMLCAEVAARGVGGALRNAAALAPGIAARTGLCWLPVPGPPPQCTAPEPRPPQPQFAGEVLGPTVDLHTIVTDGACEALAVLAEQALARAVAVRHCGGAVCCHRPGGLAEGVRAALAASPPPRKVFFVVAGGSGLQAVDAIPLEQRERVVGILRLSSEASADRVSALASCPVGHRFVRTANEGRRLRRVSDCDGLLHPAHAAAAPAGASRQFWACVVPGCSEPSAALCDACHTAGAFEAHLDENGMGAFDGLWIVHWKDGPEPAPTWNIREPVVEPVGTLVEPPPAVVSHCRWGRSTVHFRLTLDKSRWEMSLSPSPRGCHWLEGMQYTESQRAAGGLGTATFNLKRAPPANAARRDSHAADRAAASAAKQLEFMKGRCSCPSPAVVELASPGEGMRDLHGSYVREDCWGPRVWRSTCGRWSIWRSSATADWQVGRGPERDIFWMRSVAETGCAAGRQCAAGPHRVTSWKSAHDQGPFRLDPSVRCTPLGPREVAAVPPAAKRKKPPAPQAQKPTVTVATFCCGCARCDREPGGPRGAEHGVQPNAAAAVLCVVLQSCCSGHTVARLGDVCAALEADATPLCCAAGLSLQELS
eukprot:TRINITY_DN28172_c0_g1_i1.p1 TRINITY_DN28172_c0_g1~~TRINITY_DN28172_c0_g1_i1.p1  ORF type:complete len:906 (+),score=162.22 TRINITY_DN28172_c0_g1_i1:92-2719(+)